MTATLISPARICLRPISREHTDAVLGWRNDPAVARQMFSETPPTRAEHEAWLSSLERGGNRKEFAIVLLGEERAIGTIGLSHIDWVREEAEYGIVIGDPAMRGRGVAYEASLEILRYAFDVLGLRRLVLNLFADNIAARRLYERLGFIEDPLRRGSRTKEGESRPTACMYLNRPDYLRVRFP